MGSVGLRADLHKRRARDRGASTDTSLALLSKIGEEAINKLQLITHSTRVVIAFVVGVATQLQADIRMDILADETAAVVHSRRAAVRLRRRSG